MDYAYKITSGLPGAPTAELNLTIEGNMLKGTARVTQPVSPPIALNIPVFGQTFMIAPKVTGLYVTGGQTQPGSPVFGAVVNAILGEAGNGTFWFVDSNGLHDSGIVPAKPLPVKVAV